MIELDGVGRVYHTDELARVRNEKVGLVFQRFHLMPRSTATENVALPLRYAGVGTAERGRRAPELPARVGLAERAERRPAEPSGGQQQRVAIARAPANRPELILAGEPTGNLDSSSGADIVEPLEELHREGRTVVVVTHDEQQLAGRAGRVVHMLDGRIESVGRSSGSVS